MKRRIYISILCVFVSHLISSQVLQVSPPADSQAVTVGDTLPADTLRFSFSTSASGLDSELRYDMQDSMLFDNDGSMVHLWGNAVVEYLTMKLQADYIIFNLDSSIATAQGWPDSTGQLAGFPLFTEGDQSFEAKRMRYNFKTNKGMIYDVITQEGDLFIHGAKTKYVGGGQDTLAEDVIFNQGALITTCDHPEPHYGIRSTKIKTIPNRLAVIGPSNIEINGVPTPLWLPFGFFPVTSSRRAGLIFPKDFEYSENWGFGLRDVGYFLPLSEYMDLKILGDIYFNGSWGLNLQSNYVKRYQYRGTMYLAYSKRITEVRGEIQPNVQKSFSLRVSHSQDAKAHPYRRLGGSINIQSNDFQSLNRNDANSVLTNTYSSNFSWSRNFPGKPYSLSVGFRHSQNTRTNAVTIDAPNIDFRVNRIYPFKRKNAVGKERFYEKIGFKYSGNTRSKFFATDTTIFSSDTWQNAQYGMQHRADVDASFSLFDYVHVTPSVSYEEIWFFKTRQEEFIFDPLTDIEIDTLVQGIDTIFTLDTIRYGSTADTLVRGFTPYRRYTTSVSVNTQLFATKRWSNGWLRGLRHVLKPTFSFSYEPDNSMRYVDSVRTDIRNDNMRGYSIFQGGVYGATIVSGERALLGYSFNNIFEAKLWSKKDSTEKNIKLFDNIVVSGNYNFAADTLQFSPVSIRGTTRLFKRATNFSFSAVFDPYDVDPVTNRRVDRFYQDTRGKLLRFDNLRASFNTRLTVQKLREIFRGEQEPDQTGREERDERRTRQAADEDIFFDIFNNFSINHNLSFMRVGRPGRDTTITTTHTINVRGNLNISPKWSINIGNIGYDFRSDRLTYPDVGFTRDLHCWDMSFSWQPQRGTYTFHIGVKPGSLDFIKIPNRRSNVDAFGGF
ncbi:MAG: putative LPS assembly protein LptD [Saprospiraceae bacterium]|nr:putative LPS assembly protein LptD [Saprospiraceae bacterium]